jgi:peptidoglycan/LPS O-acetylase OafA/YrhL
MKDSPNLDALRSIAVGLVVLSHLPPFIPGLESLFNYKTTGRVGVALFFVHTTLVLMFSMQRSGASYGPFLVRRIFRIYPLSMVAVLSVATVGWLVGQPLPLGDIVSNLLLVQNITGAPSWPDPLWTLPFEMQMYLLLPALYVFVLGGRSVLKAAALCAFALGAAVVARSNAVYTLLIAFVPCFLPGLLAFTLLQDRTRAVLSPAVLFLTVVAGIVVIPMLATAETGQLPLFWVLCLAVGLLIPFCREIQFRPVIAFSHWVAEHSYGIYLTHMFASAFTMTGTGPLYVKLPLYFICLAALSVLTHRFIEQPGIRLGKRLADSLARSTKAPARTARLPART